MRRFPALFVAVLFAVLPSPAHAAPALLDPVFGGDGIVTAFPDGAIATAVGIDADRRIVAVGYTTGRHVDVVIARFMPDGTPDSSFGANGHRRYDLGGADYAFDAAVIPNGGIVVVGRRSNAHDRMFVLRVATRRDAPAELRAPRRDVHRLRQAAPERERGRPHPAGPDRRRRLHDERGRRPLRARPSLAPRQARQGVRRRRDGERRHRVGRGTDQRRPRARRRRDRRGRRRRERSEPAVQRPSRRQRREARSLVRHGRRRQLDVRRRHRARRRERARGRRERRLPARRLRGRPRRPRGARRQAQRLCSTRAMDRTDTSSSGSRTRSRRRRTSFGRTARPCWSGGSVGTTTTSA